MMWLVFYHLIWLEWVFSILLGLFCKKLNEMMGLIGMGNNPMVGATVAVAVAVEEGMNK